MMAVQDFDGVAVEDGDDWAGKVRINYKLGREAQGAMVFPQSARITLPLPALTDPAQSDPNMRQRPHLLGEYSALRVPHPSE